MPRIAYLKKKFRPESRALIDQGNTIIAEYAAQGFDLTLRQLYYQMVARGIIPNNQRSYKNLGNLINDARLTGLVDWEAITDRTRNVRGNSHWTSPREIVRAAWQSYKIDHWEGQPFRPEVWIEKDALVGVIAGICQELDIRYFSCRGYTSQSEMWAAARRFDSHAQQGQHTVLIHLGDHDPSGIDMSRDIADRLGMFSDFGVEFERIALNQDQVDTYNPPPNPAKLTDSRSDVYIAVHGMYSWELDALDPTTLTTLIRDEVYKFRDVNILQEVLSREEEEKAALQEIYENL